MKNNISNLRGSDRVGELSEMRVLQTLTFIGEWSQCIRTVRNSSEDRHGIDILLKGTKGLHVQVKTSVEGCLDQLYKKVLWDRECTMLVTPNGTSEFFVRYVPEKYREHINLVAKRNPGKIQIKEVK